MAARSPFTRKTRGWITALAAAALLLPVSSFLGAQENDDCLMCHEDEDLRGERGGKEISVWVDAGKLSESVHGDLDCIECHIDLEGIDMEHDEDVEPVDCSLCHDAQAEQHAASLHGRAAAKGDKLAPRCTTCHGHHDILSHTDPRSPTATMNIPLLCGKCHHEGSPVSLTHNIPQESILENYSLSIHGEGLFKKGLTVTAVCTSCHTSHMILEHTDPRSSINRKNVAKTCTKCHGRIEKVHVKVIEGRLWEEQPHAIPSCVECHNPHKIRRPQKTPGGAANVDCLKCHSDQKLTMERDGKEISLYVDEPAYNASTHSGVACAQCHTGVKTTLRRPCAAIKPDEKVNCAICHADVVLKYDTSTHGKFAAQGDPDAPSCLDCHEKHATQGHKLPTAPTYPRNVPQLCGRCHREGEKAAKRIESDVDDIVGSYQMSIHGKGLVESGLIVSATCTNCHSSHHPLPKDDPDSTVNHHNIAKTCGTCHHGIEETFLTSIHSPLVSKLPEEKPPTCEDCHTSHSISRTDMGNFRQMMTDQCGRCHESELETFFDTIHGKVSRLGDERAAKCYDCHGTHNILPVTDANSTLSYKNIVATCGQCHTGAHRQFAGYLTHATHHDKKKYPYLFYSFWFMTILLVGTLSFFLIHTLAWLYRLWRTREIWRPHKAAPRERFYRRFTRAQRTMHLIMLLTFFTLALTGMTLKFSYMAWARVVSEALGGFDTMSVLHRTAAVILLGVFAAHLIQLWRMKRESGKGLLRFIFDPQGMMITFRDVKQFWGSLKWFLGVGERPSFGRWTYWEKFDYFAVFWGVMIIGSTGLLLWFPELGTRILPGWTVNVATIIHSDEALLAVAFIFTIHFFNTHFRPDKFPMDMVIFTGRVSLEELRHDKPEEYERLIASKSIKEIDESLVDAFPKEYERGFRVFGFIALTVGLTLILLISYTMLFGYR